MLDLLQEGLKKVLPVNWDKFDKHVQKVENDMWDKEGLVDSVCDDRPVILYPGLDLDPDDADDDELSDLELDEAFIDLEE